MSTYCSPNNTCVYFPYRFGLDKRLRTEISERTVHRLLLRLYREGMPMLLLQSVDDAAAARVDEIVDEMRSGIAALSRVRGRAERQRSRSRSNAEI